MAQTIKYKKIDDNRFEKTTTTEAKGETRISDIDIEIENANSAIKSAKEEKKRLEGLKKELEELT